MNSIKVLSGQSLFDIAIQECGSAEAVVQLALLNDISITDNLQIGQSILLPNNIENKENVQYFKSRGLNPATDINKSLVRSGIFNRIFNKIFK